MGSWGEGNEISKRSSKKTSKLSRDSTMHTVTHILSVVPLAYEHVCNVIKFLELNTSFIPHSILCAQSGKAHAEIDTAWVLELELLLSAKHKHVNTKVLETPPFEMTS